MRSQIAATPAPAVQGTGVKVAQQGGSRKLHSDPFPHSKRTDAADTLEAWSSRAIEAGAHMRLAAMTWNRAVSCQHAHSIGAAFEQIDEAKSELDELLDEALEGSGGPSPALLAQAAREFRGQRNGARIVVPATPARQQKSPAVSLGKGSEATARERERLRRAHPAPWTAGERAGLRNEGAPSNFTSWSADERAAFFAAAHLVGLAKLREKK
jgi:hypothetical protein